MILYAVNKDFNFGSINSFQFLSVNPPHFSSKTIRGQFNTAVQLIKNYWQKCNLKVMNGKYNLCFLHIGP